MYLGFAPIVENKNRKKAERSCCESCFQAPSPPKAGSAKYPVLIKAPNTTTLKPSSNFKCWQFADNIGFELLPWAINFQQLDDYYDHVLNVVSPLPFSHLLACPTTANTAAIGQLPL